MNPPGAGVYFTPAHSPAPSAHSPYPPRWLPKKPTARFSRCSTVSNYDNNLHKHNFNSDKRFHKPKIPHMHRHPPTTEGPAHPSPGATRRSLTSNSVATTGKASLPGIKEVRPVLASHRESIFFVPPRSSVGPWAVWGHKGGRAKRGVGLQLCMSVNCLFNPIFGLGHLV